MRLFVGLPLASEVLKELSEAVVRLRSTEDGLRWTSPDSWHITLQFLGGSDERHFDCLMLQLAKIHAAPVLVRLGELGFFDRARVLFVDVVPTPGLVALVQRVEKATGKCGFVAEARPYHPHITLARAKGDGRGESSSLQGSKIGIGGRRPLSGQPIRFAGFRATEFVLYESRTLPEGAEHLARGRFVLSAPE
jgi:RNA 2',3'-cyclic 3'-phosphodiesterase